eukprot:119744_1
MSTTQIIYFIFVAINTLIIAPICCFYCYKFWMLRQQPLLSKRYPKLALSTIISCLIYSIFLRTLADLPRIIPSFNYGSVTKHVRLLFYNSSHIFYTITYYRIWLLYHDYKRGLHLISKQWQSKLISNHHNHTHWTIKYKFLSNKSTVLRWLCLFWILFVEICILCSTLISAENIVQPIFLSIFIVAFSILLFKVRECRDECFFATESKILAVIGSIFVVIYTLIVFAFDSNHQIKALLLYIITMITIFSFILILTKWSINEYYKRTNVVNNIALTKTSINIKFVDILKNKDALDLFAFHLVKEFSIENLLFLYQSMQWKIECVDNQLIQHENIGMYLDFGKNIATKRPKFDEKDLHSFYYEFKCIVDRYIIDSGEYCVNVSSQTKNKIMGVIALNDSDKLANQLSNHIDDHKQATKLENHQLLLTCIQVMDEAIHEIVKLISSDSFIRFSKTIQFKKLYAA